jgi:hypothetical protein
MKRFNTIVETFLTILTVVPFSLIGTIVVGIAASNPANVEASQVQKTLEAKSYQNFLSGGRAQGCANHPFASWISYLLTHVSQFDSAIVGSISPGSTGLPRVWQQFHANG